MARKPIHTCSICNTLTAKKNLTKTEYFPQGVCEKCKIIHRIQKITDKRYVVLYNMGENNFNGKWLLGIAYNINNITSTLELGGKKYPRTEEESKIMFDDYVDLAKNNYMFG